MRPIPDNILGLRKVEDPPVNEECREEDKIDIVVVHGMGAHPQDTWCSSIPTGMNASGQEDPQGQSSEASRYIDWVKDKEMLPSLMPKARIMRFGYRSDSWGPDAVQTRGMDISFKLLYPLAREREGCPERPLIFIAHSFGGLVVLQTLVNAKLESSKYSQIYNSVIGLVFFSTPFRGTDGKFSQGYLLDCVEKIHKQVYKQNYETFQSGNDNLLGVVDRFLAATGDDCRPRVACFFEKKRTDVGRLLHQGREPSDEEISVLLVSEHSGCLDLDGSTAKWSRACDHFEMNKFRSNDEEDFIQLGSYLSDMVKHGPKMISERKKGIAKQSPQPQVAKVERANNSKKLV